MQTYSIPFVLDDIVKFSENRSTITDKFKVIGIDLRDDLTVWYSIRNLTTGHDYSFWVPAEDLIKG